MKIKQITDKKIFLTLPIKQRNLGLFLTTLGLLIPIYLYIINYYQIFFVNNSNFKSVILNLSLVYLLVYIFIFEIPYIYYFFSIRNINTTFGHILLLIINIIGYISIYSSIFSFLPILITGIYLITHFKTYIINKTNATFNFHERIFLLFYTRKTIPFSEIKEFILEYKIGLRFLNKKEDQSPYNIILYLFERDPGFEHIPITTDGEEESPDFFRPQILRKTLISKPILIDSSFLNFKGHELAKFNKLIKELLQITGFSRTEEIIKDKKTIIKFKK